MTAELYSIRKTRDYGFLAVAVVSNDVESRMAGQEL